MSHIIWLFHHPYVSIKILHLLITVMFAFIFSEMDLLLVPYWADRELDLVQWPPFLLASKVLFSSLFFSSFGLILAASQ